MSSTSNSTQQIQNWWNHLKPMERRWAVGAGSLVFLMMNYFFIWPHFGELKLNNKRIEVAEATNSFFQAELSKKGEYQRRLTVLQNGGDEVLPEDQAIDFVHFVDSRAVSNGVVITTRGQLNTHTNEFFIEQQLGINAQAYETNLVKFLASLGEGNSMMRVRSMTLHPEQNHFQLSVGVTLVASYQKKVSERRGAGSTGKTVAPVTRVSRPAPATPAAAPAATPAPVPTLATPPGLSRPAPPGGAPQRLQPPGQIPQATATSRTNKLAGAFARGTATNGQPRVRPQ